MGSENLTRPVVMVPTTGGQVYTMQQGIERKSNAVGVRERVFCWDDRGRGEGQSGHGESAMNKCVDRTMRTMDSESA
jgi:hypothetical protein